MSLQNRCCSIVILLTSLLSAISATNLAPSFTLDINNLVLSERTPVGEVVFTLEGTDPENSPVHFGLHGTDLLRVDRDSGDVTVVKPLDREVNDTLNFFVTIEDEVSDAPLGGNNVVEVPVTVIILDENDNAPFFIDAPYEVHVEEDTTVGTTIFRGIALHDPDSVGETLEVSCIDLPEFPSACDSFAVEALDATESSFGGVLTLEKPLNYAEMDEYQLTLKATDGTLTSNTTLRVYVGDVQNTPPTFQGDLKAAILENAPINTLIMTVHAIDGDRQRPRKIFYELVNNPMGYFLLDAVNGELRTARPLDREAIENPTGTLLLTIKARELVDGTKGDDPLTVSTAEASITVEDVNDEPPIFNKRDYYVEIPENIAEGSAFPNLNMTVRDPDLGSNSVFSLELDDISGAFSIDPQIAEGTTDVSIRISNSSLDYENPNQRKFIILVIAKEVHTDLLLSSTATITVTVADANDNAPMFDQDSYSATISEMASPGSLVATIVAKDRDSGKFGDNGLVYQLSGSGAEKFRVNNRTGTITVTECTLPGSEDCLDYETKAEYLLMFRATDDDGKGQTTNVPLKITLTDSNDNAPMFGLPIYRVFIDEGAVRFDPDLIVTARDADKTSHVTYTIIAGNVDDLFYIDPNTGRIRITNNKGLDMSNDTETNDNLVLTVEANDGKYTATTLLNIIVRDVNNNAPIFEKENYILSIAEDTKVGTSVLQVVATDADIGENAEIEYHLQKGALDDFDINAKSGVISIVSKLDFDRRNTYNVEVVAIDKGDPSLSTTVPLTVTVINTNDKLPYFVPATQKAEVLEDAPIGTVVHTLIALDPDVNSSEALNFAATEPITALDKHGRQVLTGTDEFKEFFAVNKNTGKVTVLNPIRRDLAAVVRISVLVTDITATAIQQGQGMLIITITDVNDSPPSFVPPWTPQNPIYKLELKEEQPVGTIVATYSAYDEDSDIAGYAINPTSEYFEINKGTGIIQIKKIIDYEVTQHLNFTIYAYDSGFPQLNASAKVEVDVMNVNDNNPVFDEQEYNVTIDENLPEGAHIIQVHATDKDLGDFGLILYSLVGEHKEHFAINPRTGQITVSDSDFLDREVLSDVTVQVLASDSSDSGSSALKRTHSVPVHIIISDVNDNAPKFNQSVYSVRVVENVRMNPPVPIAQVLAIDKDVGEYGTVRYRIIAGNDDGVFLLSEDNGILYPHKSLMGQTHMFRLLVEARDGDGPHAFTDRATINVQVENINEHKPKFLMPALSNATVEITENAATVDFLVMTVKATDKDIGENGRVTYHLKLNDSIVQSTDEFIIDPDTGELRTRKYLDRHMQSRYELILVARDHGIPTWYETIQHLSVLLVDTSDNKPEFPDTKTASPYIFHITENGSKDVRIGQVKVLNKPYHITPGNPATAPVYYYIIGGNEDRSFYLDKLDGSIYTNRSFDREKRTAYELYVLANNDPEFYLTGAATEGTGSDEMQSIMREYDGSVAKVRVEVEDVNDNPPKFPYEIYHAAVNAMASVNEFILNVTAVDPDRGVNGSLSYYIKASNLYKYGSSVSSGSIIPSPFNITQDGQLNTATYLAENNQHRFMVDVVAKENAWPERQSIAKVHIWVFEPNQLNRIILSRPVEEVLRERDEIIAELSNATQSLVIVDEIRYHTDDLGRKNDDWSDMYILVVDPRTYTIVPVTEVLKTIDAQYDFLKDYYAGFAIENVVPAFITEKEEAFDPALAALIALLIVLCVGVITFIVVCCCLRHWAMTPSSSLKKKDALIKKAIIDDLNTTENPLWIEQKLKIYEEQELTMQVFNEPEQTALARRDSEEFIPDENTYATIQHPTRRGSQHMATLSLNDEIADYATLSRVPNSCYEAAMGFQGSTFQVPESASNSADFESYNISRYKNGSNGSLEGSKNRQTNYVTELL